MTGNDVDLLIDVAPDAEPYLPTPSGRDSIWRTRSADLLILASKGF